MPNYKNINQYDDILANLSNNDYILIWDFETGKTYKVQVGALVSAIKTVNGDAGPNVVLDADDISDATTIKKFIDAAGLLKVALIKNNEDANKYLAGDGSYRDPVADAALVSLADIDLSDIDEGESKILLVKKEVGTGNPVFQGGVTQLDKLVATATFNVLLADTAAWVSDQIALTGDNRNGQLGENGQEHQMNGQFYLCISHSFGTGPADGSATWVRNRSNDAIQPDIIAQDGLVADQLDPSRTGGGVDDGWNVVTNTKTIAVRSKVGSWWVNPAGYVYFCYGEAGANWSWKRIAQPDAIFVTITDATLIAEIEAHDFGAAPILQPVATEKGKDRQELYWESPAGTPHLVKCIDDGGTKKWIKLV